MWKSIDYKLKAFAFKLQFNTSEIFNWIFILIFNIKYSESIDYGL